MGLIGPKVSKNVNVASMVAYTPRGHINIQFSPLLKGVPCIASASRDRFPGLHHVYIIRKTWPALCGMNKTTTPAAVQSSNKGLGSIGKCGCLCKYYEVGEAESTCTTAMAGNKGLRHLLLLLKLLILLRVHFMLIGLVAALALCEIRNCLWIVRFICG